MMRKSLLRAVAIAPLILGLTVGCHKDVLSVPNLSNPDVVRVYATPASIEGVISTLYQQAWGGFQGNQEGMNVQSKNIALEIYGNVANFGMNTRNAVPRVEIFNDRGNSVATGNARDFSQFSKLGRSASTALQAMDRLNAAKNTLGSPAQDARARAFGWFVLGVSQGYLSFAYDSGAIVSPAIATDAIPGLSAYPAVNAAALVDLDSALAYTNSAAASNTNGVSGSGFPLPSTWIQSTTSMTQANFAALIRAHKARIRAGVARTPAERQAVDWTSVIADANAALQNDFVITIASGTSWSCTYDCSQMEVSAGWGQVSPWYYAMADTSGAYAAWLATPFSARSPALLIMTPDQRWPQGNTRLAQINASPLPLTGRLYFNNRPAGNDVPDNQSSSYDHSRWWSIRNSVPSGNGPYVHMAATEMKMLAAEGYIRGGNLGAATTLINASRASAGLPQIAVPSSATAAITPATPGAFAPSGCVPQVPNSTATAVGCGSIMEAMKWEKRMETAMTGYMQWFNDSRGWGDLLKGSPLQWPVPYGEMDSRNHPFYNSSKSLVAGGGAAVAALGTYGFQ
jgi:hypothetical protein